MHVLKFMKRHAAPLCIAAILLLILATMVLAITGASMLHQKVPGPQWADERGLCQGTYVVELRHFLTGAECDALVNAAMRRGLKPSTIGLTNSSVDLSTRISDQAWFEKGEHPVVDTLHAKTRAFLATIPHDLPRTAVFESLQVARYTPGGKYDLHYDGDEMALHVPRDQRLANMLVYLQEPEGGGDTYFPFLDTRITPTKGKAVFFWIADPRTGQLYRKTQHAGLPVTRGTKWIANAWIKADAEE
jgi:prolyl 4-hydroxylase